MTSPDAGDVQHTMLCFAMPRGDADGRSSHIAGCLSVGFGEEGWVD